MLGALALIAASCEKDLEPSFPQVNPQEPILTDGDITSVPFGVFAEQNPSINLADYSEYGTQIQIMSAPETKNLPEGALVNYKLELATDDTFSTSVIVDAPNGDSEATVNNCYVDAAAWNAAHIQLFGKNPAPRTVYYRIPVYVTIDGSNFRYDSLDTYCMQGTIQESCYVEFAIEQAYYLISDVTTTNLSDAATVEQFALKNSGVDAYDDPIFTIKFDVTSDQIGNFGGVKWQIAPQSLVGTTNTAALYGPVEAENFSGELTANGAKGILTEPGKYELVADFSNNTFTLSVLNQPEVLYTPGDSNGWNQLNSAWLALYTEKEDKALYMNYYGVSPLSSNGGFKICEQDSWNDATDWGVSADDPTDKLVLGGSASNIPVPQTGVYWIEVMYDQTEACLSTYSLTEITSLGLIGSFEGSGWTNDIELTPVEGAEGDYAANVTFATDDKFKVRFNESWDYNLGGRLDKLVYDASDITVETAGTYTVTLHLLGGYPRITMEKQ